MVRVDSFTSTENRATFPGKSLIQRRHANIHRIADVNVANVRFRNRNHEPEQIILGKLHDRHRLRARTGSRLHQRSQIRIALGHDAGRTAP